MADKYVPLMPEEQPIGGAMVQKVVSDCSPQVPMVAAPYKILYTVLLCSIVTMVKTTK